MAGNLLILETVILVKCLFFVNYFLHLAMFKRSMLVLVEIVDTWKWIAHYLNHSVPNQRHMIYRYLLSAVVLFLFCPSLDAQEVSKMETNLAGVFQNKTLFIQNPYNRQQREFCIREVQINGRPANINYNLSALKIDFDGLDPFTPVKIKVLHKDTLCAPIIINPEAVLFHTIFRFSEIALSDSSLYWFTKGERGQGEFEIERLYNGIWVEQETITASGRYEGQGYSHLPSLEEGSNKYRVRYNFPRGSRVTHLYSPEVEFEFYPERVEFKPKSAKTTLLLSRATHYEIYDQGNTLVLEGEGTEVDVRRLRRGDYVIYFDGKYPGSFVKE